MSYSENNFVVFDIFDYFAIISWMQSESFKSNLHFVAIDSRQLTPIGGTH